MRESFGQYQKFCHHRGFNSLAAPPSPAPGVNNIAYMPQVGDQEKNVTEMMMNYTLYYNSILLLIKMSTQNNNSEPMGMVDLSECSAEVLSYIQILHSKTINQQHQIEVYKSLLKKQIAEEIEADEDCDTDQIKIYLTI